MILTVKELSGFYEEDPPAGREPRWVDRTVFEGSDETARAVLEVTQYHTDGAEPLAHHGDTIDINFGTISPAVPPVNVDVPVITHTGGTISCTMGNWDGEPTLYHYQWYRDDVAVGTDSKDYAVTPDDAGHSITCVVTAVNPAGETMAPPSNAIML